MGIPELPEPPDDAEEWSDEEWIAYLKATDPEHSESEGDDGSFPPATWQGKLARSSVGRPSRIAMKTLHDIIYGELEDAAEVQEAAGEPGDRDFDIELDPDGHVARVKDNRNRSSDSGEAELS